MVTGCGSVSGRIPDPTHRWSQLEMGADGFGDGLAHHAISLRVEVDAVRQQELAQTGRICHLVEIIDGEPKRMGQFD